MKTTRNRFSLEPPFPADAVLYRHVPASAGADTGVGWDLAQEYVVSADPNAVHGIRIYGRHTAGWLAYPAGARALVAQLVADRQRLLTLCQKQRTLLLEWEALSRAQLTQTGHGKKRLAALIAPRGHTAPRRGH